VRELAENAAGQPCGRAWLDVQRYACFASQFAGTNGVTEAILAGLKSLLTEIPQLLQWTLADDTPVANPETLGWLKEQSVLPGAEPAAAETAAPPPVPQMWYPPPEPARPAEDGAEPARPDAYQLAIQTAQSGNLEEALEILSRELAQEPSGRDRFLRKMQLAQLCLATGNEAIAEPVLKELAEEIDRRNLQEWELADMVAQPLTLLYRCLDRAPDAAAEKRDLYARICRLNPARAVRLPR
jgi:type VI secretion system protein ImpA